MRRKHKRYPEINEGHPLIGKRVAWYRLGKSHSGYREGKVTRVTLDREGKLLACVAKGANGVRYRVTAKELTMPNMSTTVGIIWFGKLRNLETWLNERGALI